MNLLFWIQFYLLQCSYVVQGGAALCSLSSTNLLLLMQSKNSVI